MPNNNKQNIAKVCSLNRYAQLALCLAIVFLVVFFVLLAIRIVDAQKQEALKNLRPAAQEMGETSPAVPIEGHSTPDPTQALADAAKASPATTSTLDPKTEPTSTIEITPIPPRFQELYQLNSDFVGWLTLGDGIEGPVVFSGDDYYLDKDFYKEFSKSGTLYIDWENTDWPTDSYVVIYGHNMKNGTMFGDLSEFRKKDYLKAHPLVYFDTIAGENEIVYVPFAAFDISCSAAHSKYFSLRQLDNFKQKHEENLHSLFETVYKRSLYQIPVEVNAEDRILVLTTCSYVYPDGRFLLFCRQLRENESAEAMASLIQQS